MPSFFAVPSIICVSSCPARPTNGMPCASSSAPGPSPTNTSGDFSSPHSEDQLLPAFVQRGTAGNRRCPRRS